MALEFCDKCKSMHYRTDACRAPKSTAALTEVLDRKMGAEGAAAPEVEATAPPETSGHASPAPAGTQAPPVDTTIVGKRRGRPQTITDMKAYKAEKERQRRTDGKVKPRAKK